MFRLQSKLVPMQKFLVAEIKIFCLNSRIRYACPKWRTTDSSSYSIQNWYVGFFGVGYRYFSIRIQYLKIHTIQYFRMVGKCDFVIYEVPYKNVFEVGGYKFFSKLKILLGLEIRFYSMHTLRPFQEPISIKRSSKGQV